LSQRVRRALKTAWDEGYVVRMWRTVEEAIWPATEAFPLVTIHREVADPEVCHNGAIERVNARRVLHEIGSDAYRNEEATLYRCPEITHVDFGGDYEETLWLASEARTTNAKSANAGPVYKPVKGSRQTLDELMIGVTEDNLHAEIDFGPSQGKEA
jgi:hypothetical protein